MWWKPAESNRKDYSTTAQISKSLNISKANTREEEGTWTENINRFEAKKKEKLEEFTFTFFFVYAPPFERISTFIVEKFVVDD